jgi:hypothetical protein
MATQIYNTKKIKILNGEEIQITPLKIKYLREFMDAFEPIKTVSNDLEAISILTECARISMQQYYPEISKSIDDIEDNLNMPMVYKIIDVAAGIKINQKKEESVKSQAVESGNSWEDLDLAKLESEVFLLGIWKDYHELEISLSMPELMATIEISRELNYTEKKFLAAIQGVDLDKESGASRGQKEWEDMKARVFSRGKTSDSNDVLSLQGQNARKAGFGIGMGLDYDDLRAPSVMKE